MSGKRPIYHSTGHERHPGWTDKEGQPWDVPERLYGIVDGLLADTTPNEWVVVPEVHLETLEMIGRIHSSDMISAIYETGRQASNDAPLKSSFDRDTETNASAIYPGTFEQAFYSAEVALAAADALLNSPEKRMAIALSRPPGHHAGRDFYHGFCYFNNAAAAAQAFTDAGKRVAILDIDVHHGDGTQDIFKEDPNVLYVSLHADPAEVFPNTGLPYEEGEGAGRGTTLNLPFPIGVSNAEYFALLTYAQDKIREFGADCLIVDAGFDGHAREFPNLPPLTNLDNPEYTDIGRLLGSMNMQSLIIMEGGYNHDVTPGAFVSFVNGFEQGAHIRQGTEIYTSEDVLYEAE